MILPIQTKIYYSYPFLDNGFSSFYHSYSNNNGNSLHDQQHPTESSYSLTDLNYLQSQGSNIHTLVETSASVSLKPPFIKRILLVDDDPDVTLTFKAGLEGHYYSNGDKKKRFEVYAYNDPLLVVKEFKPHFYDLLLTDIYMPSMNGFQLREKVLELDVNIRVCFMSALEVNISALRDIYPNISFGCFIEKPVSIDYLINRLSEELDYS
ncbi:MAG TPA: response regulator [Nitrososphaeraceae archaeon]|jgi:CheY-like chemotaxis protein